MLGAARQAYAITATGPVPSVSWETDIGYVNPAGFAAGTERINAGLVGEANDAIFVAFRGTLPPASPDNERVIVDWANDCDAILVPDPLGLAGNVHQGFLGALNDLWPAMIPVITSIAASSPSKPIYVTGHSKGGPMANLAAARLAVALPTATVIVGTFAGARAGDATFAAAYDARVVHSARYEYQDDIVPHLPPSDAFRAMFSNIPRIGPTIANLNVGYVSVGTLYFIDWSGAIEGQSAFLDFERFTHLARLIATFNYSTIIADHSIDPGSGYYTALYN